MAKVDTLTDNFNDNSISGSWDTSNSNDSTQVYERQQQIEITHTANIQYNALQSATTYDLTASYAHIRITGRGNQSLASHEVIFGIILDSNNKLWFTLNANTIAAYKNVAGGGNTLVGTAKTYNLSEHRWLRIREASGTTYFDTSYDGINWTVFQSLANPFTLTAIKPYIQSGCYANEASSTGGQFDDFNVVQSAGRELPVYRYIRVGDGMSRSEGAT